MELTAFGRPAPSLGLAPICPCPSPLSGSSLSSGTCTAFGPGTVRRQKGRPGGVHTRGCGTLPKAFREGEGLAFPLPATRVPSQWCGSTVLGREKPGFAVRATSSCRSRAPRGGRVFRAAPGRPSGRVARTAHASPPFLCESCVSAYVRGSNLNVKYQTALNTGKRN